MTVLTGAPARGLRDLDGESGATLTAAGRRRLLLRRYVPAIPAVVAVGAAGAAFERVFGWGNTVGPLISAVVLGALGGAVGRIGLAGPGLAAAHHRAAGADLAGDPGLAAEAGSEGRMAPAPPVGGHVLAVTAVVLTTLLAPVVVAALFASPGPGGPGRAVSSGIGALAGGWSRILTTSVPVPPTASRLPLLAGVVALGAALAVISATRRRPGIRALVPAGLVMLVALVLGVHGPGSLTAVVAPVALAGAAYLLLVSRPTEDGATWVPPSRTIAAVATGAVVVVLALAIGADFPFASSRQPVNLRTRLSPPVDLGTTPNPLNEVPARQSQPGAVMFTAEVDRTWLASPLHWRIASLDSYDGAGWTSDAKATRAGNQLAAPAAVDTSTLGPETTYRLQVSGLGGPWVPTSGLPTQVSPADLAYDPATTTLLAPTGPSGAPAATSFTVTSRLPDPSRGSLDTAALPSGTTAAELTSVPACFPAPLRELATSVVANQGRPDQQAVAIEQALAGGHGYTLNTKAAPGSSCGRLKAFAATRSGTVEQYATAFALMARSVGLPARLAVGFQPGAISSLASAAGSSRFSGTTVVRGSDATVWPEVDFAALGWEAFSPFPTSAARGSGGQGVGATTTVPQLDQGLNQVRQTVAAQAGGTAPHPNRSAAISGRVVPGAGGGFNLLWLIPILVAALLLGLLVARLALRAQLRGSRRAAPTPAGRIRGAWAEVLDAFGPLAAGGLSSSGGLSTSTPGEVHAAVATRCPAAAEPTLEVARAVDRAVFAEVASEEVASAAWASSQLAVSALRSAMPAGMRLRVLLAGGAGRGAGGAGRRR